MELSKNHPARACRLSMREISGALDIQTRSVSMLAQEGARRVSANPTLIRTWNRSVKILKQTHPEISGNIPYET